MTLLKMIDRTNRSCRVEQYVHVDIDRLYSLYGVNIIGYSSESHYERTVVVFRVFKNRKRTRTDLNSSSRVGLANSRFIHRRIAFNRRVLAWYLYFRSIFGIVKKHISYSLFTLTYTRLLWIRLLSTLFAFASRSEWRKPRIVAVLKSDKTTENFRNTPRV